MDYEKVTLRLTGLAPLIMHNGQLANPLDEGARALRKLTSKRKKTDADHEELARVEFYGGLYMDEGGPIIPNELLLACLIAGARKSKEGMQAQAGIIVDAHATLIYDGPRDAAGLWMARHAVLGREFAYTKIVRVGAARLVRTRPIFRRWQVETAIEYLPDIVNESQVVNFATNAGRLVGIGDRRPQFGRFKVEVIKL